MYYLRHPREPRPGKLRHHVQGHDERRRRHRAEGAPASGTHEELEGARAVRAGGPHAEGPEPPGHPPVRRQLRARHRRRSVLLPRAAHRAGQVAPVPRGRGLETHGTEVVAIAEQLLEVLGYLSSLRPPVCHRDVKPGNVLLDVETGRVSLVDFGATADAAVTTAMAAEGTTGGGYAQGDPPSSAPLDTARRSSTWARWPAVRSLLRRRHRSLPALGQGAVHHAVHQAQGGLPRRRTDRARGWRRPWRGCWSRRRRTGSSRPASGRLLRGDGVYSAKTGEVENDATEGFEGRDGREDVHRPTRPSPRPRRRRRRVRAGRGDGL